MRLLLILVIIILGIGGYLAVKPPSEDKQPIAEEISISILPDKIEQGDPVLIQIHGTTTAKSLKVNDKELKTFIHDGKLSALVGLDLRSKSGSLPMVLTLNDGRIITSRLAVGERYIAKAPLGIPEKLGGDTPEAERELINTLVEEGKLISAVPTEDEKLWEGEFRLPIDEPITITDTYGYSRLTGASSISHKGTDFRAAVGTSVYAMNSGKVAYTGYLRNYGNVIALDHGLGLLTIYMHLSKIEVVKGDKVDKGQLIAKSGDTGYVLGPHLHITVRINGISIDPMKFMALLGE